jgi:hypothetical protein
MNMQVRWMLVAWLSALTTAAHAGATVTQNKHGDTHFTFHNGRASHVTSTLGAVQAEKIVAKTGDHLVSTPSGTHGVTGTPSRSATATSTGVNSR